MKFYAAKQDLEEAISLVSNSISVAPDISGHYLFRGIPGEKGKVEVRTYSGRLSSGCPFVATLEGDDRAEFTVEGKRLKAFLGSIDDCVITFDADQKGLVVVTAPGMGTQHFQGLDPTPFPHWDALLGKSKLTATVPALRFAEALSYARPFASTDETKTPHLCVCEARNGVMAASNVAFGAGVYLFLPLLKEAGIRIHVKDIGAILAFLSKIEGDVEVHETERVSFYVRADGAILGESRLNVEYPKIKVPPSQDKHWWKIDTAKALRALPFLKSGASEENLRIHLSRPASDGPVKFSMMTKTGKVSEVEVACFDAGSTDDKNPIPQEGFYVGYNPLLKLLELHRDQIETTLGINPLPPIGGYLRIVDDKFKADGQDADQYITIVAWLK